MKRYLAELHKKSDYHKKRFAFLASGAVTLFIFGAWSLVIFPPRVDPSLALGKSEDAKVSEVSPFQSLGINLAASISALRDSFKGLEAKLKDIDFETNYIDIRKEALDTYGQ